MDSLSQVVLGASVGGAVMGRTLGRSALLGGALLGTLPDLDVLIDYGDAVANFTEHRGFSHSLLVLLPASLLLAWGLQRWATRVTCTHWTTRVSAVRVALLPTRIPLKNLFD